MKPMKPIKRKFAWKFDLFMHIAMGVIGITAIVSIWVCFMAWWGLL